jgi:hypothetical protein
MRKYLVVIDTTNQPKARGFTKAIQNFYIVRAPDEHKAKAMVMGSFGNNQNIKEQLWAATKATPLDVILKLLDSKNNSWSYVPIGRVRAPGQQGVNDSMRMLNQVDKAREQGREVSHTEVQIPVPETYDAQVVQAADLAKEKIGPVDEGDLAVLNSSAAGPNNVDPNMAAMFTQFMEMMKQTGMAPNPEPQVDMTKHDPKNDPTIQERIQANLKSGPDIGLGEYVDDGTAPMNDEIVPDASAGEAPEGWDDDLTSVD